MVDLLTGRQQGETKKVTKANGPLKISPDGVHATFSEDNVLSFWNVERGSGEDVGPIGAHFDASAFSNKGALIVASEFAGVLLFSGVSPSADKLEPVLIDTLSPTGWSSVAGRWYDANRSGEGGLVHGLDGVLTPIAETSRGLFKRPHLIAYVRKKLWEGGEFQKPFLIVSSPENGAKTSAETIDVALDAEERELFIETVTITVDGKELEAPIESGKKTIHFRSSIPLKTGENKISIAVSNGVESTTKELVVFRQ